MKTRTRNVIVNIALLDGNITQAALDAALAVLELSDTRDENEKSKDVIDELKSKLSASPMTMTEISNWSRVTFGHVGPRAILAETAYRRVLDKPEDFGVRRLGKKGAYRYCSL